MKDQRLKILIHDSDLAGYIEIENEVIQIYANPKKKSKPEFRIKKEEIPLFEKMFSVLSPREIFQNYSHGELSKFPDDVLNKIKTESEKNLTTSKSPDKPLEGIKIAIDPGHFSMDSEGAKIDERYMSVELDGEKINFFEADLSLATAKYLKSFLEKYGSEVFITRQERGKSSYGMFYEDWLKDLEKIKNCLEERFFYHEEFKNHSFENFYATNCDIRNRAKMINAFHPDLTIIIHFNVDDFRNGLPSDKNYSLIFVPGSFLADELRNKMDRIQFLRLFLTSHLQDSILLSEKIEKQFNEYLKVPPLPQKLETEIIPTYTKHCVFVQDGIWARNLSLTRLVHSPLAYTEVLYQNNREELKNLSNLTEEIDGMKTSKRIKGAATAHFYGIVEYLHAKGNIDDVSKERLLKDKF